MTKISDSHIRVILKTKAPAITAQNKKQARDLELVSGAVNNQASVSVKRWSNNQIIKALRAELAATRNHINKVATAPDFCPGAWLVNSKKWEDLFDAVNNHKATFNHLKSQAVKEYTEKYDDIMDEEVNLNGELSRDINYPTPEEFSNSWDMDILLEEIEPGSFIGKVEKETEEFILSELRRTQEVKDRELRSYMRDTLTELVTKMVSVLENGDRINKRSFNKIHEFVDNIHENDVTDDFSLRQFSDEIKEILNTYSPEELREVPGAKDTIQRRFQQVENDMGLIF